MNDREKVLNYLSGLLKDEEKIEFENELAKSESLKSEYKRVQKQLSLLNTLSDVEQDQQYFNSIVPRIREKLDRRGKSYIHKYSMVTSAAAVILLLIVLRLPDITSLTSALNYSAVELNSYLSAVDSSDLNEFLGSNYFQEYSSYYDEAFMAEIGEEGVEIAFNNFGEDYPTQLYYNNTSTELLNTLSEEELEQVYENLLNKKIL